MLMRITRPNVRLKWGFQFILNCAAFGKLGKVFSVRGRTLTQLSKERHWKAWDSEDERKGIVMCILAPHFIDIIVGLLDRPNRVTYFAQQLDYSLAWSSYNTNAVFRYPEAIGNVATTKPDNSCEESVQFEVYDTRGISILIHLSRLHSTALS